MLRVTHVFEDTGHEKSGSATGFILQYPSGDKYGLVTNRHVVDIPWRWPERKGMNLKSLNVLMWHSDVLRLSFDMPVSPIHFHPDDSTLDVCVIPFSFEGKQKVTIAGFGTPENFEFDEKTETMSMALKHALSWQSLVEAEKLWPTLRPGEITAFPAYPVWHDKKQNRPVLRTGIIASDPQTDYRLNSNEPTVTDGNRQVLFDAFSTEGSSGAPVFVAQRGMQPMNLAVNLPSQPKTPAGFKLDFPDYHPSFFIGINVGHYNEENRDHAGLSRMQKLSAILDIVRATDSTGEASPTGSITGTEPA
ncbi:hypothetical protein [Mycobacteroides abscessus]|uniref:hypothetical protein n=1 Tax=Mycobacteroides abscessus TaxID=36809 RepID=UPI0010427193|nr:hypothetical protein [Mycobacteroides abscessus]